MDTVWNNKRQDGFTLIELMIVVVIIAITAAIAIPSYSAHICKVERGTLKGDLMAYAQALERFYSANNFSYRTSGGSLPDVYANYSPADGSAAAKHFDITLTIPSDGSAFTLSGQRSQGSCQDGTLALNNAGVRSWTRDGNTQNSWDE